MADICDEAQADNEYFNKMAVKNAIAQNYPGESLEYCEDCEEKIPVGRRKAMPGCTRCVQCQADFESY